MSDGQLELYMEGTGMMTSPQSRQIEQPNVAQEHRRKARREADECEGFNLAR